MTRDAVHEMPRVMVSENRRFLMTADGKPFFYLADTAWELFHRLDREQAVHYLDVRAGQKFTAIQAVALAEVDGLPTPNAHGALPFVDEDPARPDVKSGAYDYKVMAWWYNPRNGNTAEIGAFENAGTQAFTPQFAGFGSDWVLVLDDADRKFPPPGQAFRKERVRRTGETGDLP